MSEDRDTEQVSSTWLAQLRHEHGVFGGECARLQKDLDSCRRMFENAVMTIVTIGEAAGVRGEDQQNGHLEIVEAINKIKGRRAVYKAKATELERELEVWRSGPVCWSCGDSGEVHSLDGEWRGECNCQGAVDARRIAGLEADRDRIKTIADNYSALNMDAQAELAAIKAQEPIAWYTEDHLDDKSATTYSWTVAERWVEKGWPVSPLYATRGSEAKAQGVVPDEREEFDKWFRKTQLIADSVDTTFVNSAFLPYKAWMARARLNAAPVQQVSVPVSGVPSIKCWSCKQTVSLDDRADADGNCPHCRVALDLEEYLRAMLAAAPAAPAADALVEALEHARLFIVNGIDLGFIQMPEAGTPDPAHETLPMIDAALAAHRAKGVV